MYVTIMHQPIANCQRRSDMITCAIYLYCDFHTFLHYARRGLNVIDFGAVTLVTTILVII